MCQISVRARIQLLHGSLQKVCGKQTKNGLVAHLYVSTSELFCWKGESAQAKKTLIDQKKSARLYQRLCEMLTTRNKVDFKLMYTVVYCCAVCIVLDADLRPFFVIGISRT